jgi:hypothetical protein
MNTQSSSSVLIKELSAVLREQPSFQGCSFTDMQSISETFEKTISEGYIKSGQLNLPLLFEVMLTLDRHAKGDDKWTIKEVS